MTANAMVMREDVPQLMEIMVECASEWRQVALKMGFTGGKIANIGCDNASLMPRGAAVTPLMPCGAAVCGAAVGGAPLMPYIMIFFTSNLVGSRSSAGAPIRCELPAFGSGDHGIPDGHPHHQ